MLLKTMGRADNVHSIAKFFVWKLRKLVGRDEQVSIILRWIIRKCSVG